MSKITVPKIVGEFRRDMAERHSTFFLLYSDVDRTTGEVVVRATSNSTAFGIGAMLAPLLEPSEAAVQMMIKALPRPGWFASRAKREKQARDLLAKLCNMLVLSKMDAKPVESPPKKLTLV